jgi:hypothetical protein
MTPTRRSARSWIRRLLDDEAGTATTETVIMIPMYVIVWGCIVYVTNVFQGTIEMRARIRRDTWAYAYTSCEDRPETGTDLDVGPGLIPDPGAGSEAEGAATGGAGTAAGSTGGLAGLVGMVGDVMRFIPGLTFESLEGHRRNFSVERPAVIGGGSMTLGANLVILCNEEPANVFTFIVDAVRSAFGF